MLQNKTGRYVAPTLAEANKALAAISFKDDFSVSGAEDPADGYPIASVTWLLVKKQYEASKADAVKKMISWILTKGQDINKDLGYTRIPQKVATKANQAVSSNIAAR